MFFSGTCAVCLLHFVYHFIFGYGCSSVWKAPKDIRIRTTLNVSCISSSKFYWFCMHKHKSKGYDLILKYKNVKMCKYWIRSLSCFWLSESWLATEYLLRDSVWIETVLLIIIKAWRVILMKTGKLSQNIFKFVCCICRHNSYHLSYLFYYFKI